jgi:hypothetical protein
VAESREITTLMGRIHPGCVSSAVAVRGAADPRRGRPGRPGA